MRRRLPIIFAALSIAAVGAVLFWPRGVTAVVRNAGADTIRDVHVVVTGRSYPLGDIAPGQARSVRLRPAGESSITLRFTDSAARSAHVDCFLEPGYSGSIEIDIAGGVVSRVANNIRATP